MAEYLSPGVYVEEYDNSPRVIEGVGTSTAGFVGLAEKGPVVGAPLLVGSYKSFVQQFGGYLSEFEFGEYRYLAASVEQFFANGGTRCYVMRVAPADAECASAQKGIFKATAKNPGKWGNRVQIQVSNVRNRKMQVMEKTEAGYKVRTADGFREGDSVEFDGSYFKILTILDNIVTFDADLPEKAIDNALVPKNVLYLANFDLTVRYADQVEAYTDLSLNISSPRFLAARMNGSELVDIEVEAPDTAVDPVAAILENDGANGSFLLEGGTNGNIKKINAGTFIGVDEGPGKRTGIQAFLENNIVSMMAVPGITTPEVMVSLISHCENTHSRFAVLDMPKELYKTKDLLDYRSMVDSSYAAMYHPWVQVFDRAANKPAFVPPSGAVMGVYSRTDIARGVHKAPANEIVQCTGLSFNYTTEEQDILNPEGVNLIRALPG
ncbi:MAG: phage tail sheath subtilisin-like domain-containing protein, partial [Lachnospiraceae bacterium]|nr:phage tail sheath subtilisin-like domain-containing protein [Lachnospiraceae bacterium]